MSKWRPSKECIYVIPDIHGYYSSLQQVLNRILPLRDTDQVIFLGDYIDRGPESHLVIQKLIELDKEYGEQIVPIMGNHEWLMLAGLDLIPYDSSIYSLSPTQIWLANGGPQTIQGYCKNAGIVDYQAVPMHRFLNIVPKDHIEFLTEKMLLSYEYCNYIFCHAGCDPTQPLDDQPSELLLWDRSLYNLVCYCIKNKSKVPWSKVVVTGHNYNGPVITPNYMMLDSSRTHSLLCVELNSMEGFYAYPGRKRMLKADLKEMTKLPRYIEKYM